MTSKTVPKFTYVVYSPGWVHWSAGIKVLHYLCHALNNQGFSCYLALHGPRQSSDFNESLNTPILSREVLENLSKETCRIVAIYPESIKGNPLNAPYVVRWILNFPQLLAGETSFGDDCVLAYSKTLSRAVCSVLDIEAQVCFIPAIKIEEIDHLKSEISGTSPKTEFELIYAQKYRALGGTSVMTVPNCREIERFGPNATSRKETLEMLRDAKVLHVYENSTIITEACLLGTPVVCHENEFFHELIASEELDFTGISWDSKDIQIPDVDFNRQALISAEVQVPDNIQSIFEQLELNLKKKLIKGGARIPRRGFITRHSIKRAKIILQQKGLKALVRFFFNYMKR